MKLFCWNYGPTGNGYKLLPLIWSKKLRLDCFIFHYPLYSRIKPHTDELKNGGRHYRLNIEIWKARAGGEFKCEEMIFSLFNRIHFFRADLFEHSVSRIMDGNRYVLSIGKTFRR